MTASMIRSQELLDVARVLTPAVGRPTVTQLRRAVSTAYYALFHELVTHATTELCGADPADDAERRRASRWIAHTDLRTLAESTAHSGGVPAARAVASVLRTPHPDLGRIASAFIKLQDARHHADYDHDYHLSDSDAQSLIDRAADAIDRARRLERSGDRSYRRFLKLMVGAVRIARSRAA